MPPREDLSNVDPNLLAELEAEREFAQGGNFTERLKLDKNTGAIVRFIPMRLGSNKSWFARVAMHWHKGAGNRPANCPRASSVSVGGSPDASCPVCDAVDSLLETYASDKTIVENIGKAASWPKYLTYCFVLETIDRSGEATPKGRKARLVPHEFWVTKTGFSDLANLFRRSLKWSPTLGFTDPVHGCDIEVRADNRSYLKFELVGRGRVREDIADDAELDAWMAGLIKTIRVTDIAPTPLNKLEEFALKLEDSVNPRPTRGATRSGAGMAEGDDEDLPPPRRGRQDMLDDEPPARRRADAVEEDAPPPRRPAADPLDDEPPARRQPAGGRNEAPQPARRAAAPIDDDEPPARHAPAPRRQEPTAEPDLDADTPPPPPTTRSANRLAPPPAAATAPRRLPPAPDTQADDDELPPEHAGATPEPADDLPPPPPTSDQPPARRTSGNLSSAMRSRLAGV